MLLVLGGPSFAWAQAPATAAQSSADQSVESAPGRRPPLTLLDAIRGSDAGAASSEEPKRLDPDRPHFPEASTTVGKGRVVLESGYTFTEKGSSFVSHAYPDALLRIGMFADWFEFRIGQNFVNEQERVAGVRTRTNGAQDLYLGVKLALIQQKRYFPEIAVIPQMTVPTGSERVTAGRVLPGINVDCGWEVIKDRLNIELLIASNRVRDAVHHSHGEVATGLTVAVDVSKNLEAFMEWDAFYPQGTTGPATGPQHYAIGGIVYFVTKDFAVDARTGIGLSEHANDFVAGTGFAIRY